MRTRGGWWEPDLEEGEGGAARFRKVDVDDKGAVGGARDAV